MCAPPLLPRGAPRERRPLCGHAHVLRLLPPRDAALSSCSSTPCATSCALLSCSSTPCALLSCSSTPCAVCNSAGSAGTLTRRYPQICKMACVKASNQWSVREQSPEFYGEHRTLSANRQKCHVNDGRYCARSIITDPPSCIILCRLPRLSQRYCIILYTLSNDKRRI